MEWVELLGSDERGTKAKFVNLLIGESVTGYSVRELSLIYENLLLDKTQTLEFYLTKDDLWGLLRKLSEIGICLGEISCHEEIDEPDISLRNNRVKVGLSLS
ncbi:hypothetical protein FUAX_51640 (plasmid) [Fulvitalea axinellae]|uniref:Uncharacterized protein n=1 Tax=Fulvitalea axinellae TaxID=1182444 RepID=A0AAU9CY45_9BACT|nr:hypothetical protein FUAX_51640 [Fulvitalea axinellae]